MINIAEVQSFLSPKPELSAAKLGARAYTKGESCAANPFLASGALPSATGEAHAAWFYKVDAWWRGWDAAFRRGLH